MFRHIAFGCTAALLVLSAVAAQGRDGSKDIVDTAVAAGSFTTLEKALQAADLVDTLKERGPYTVFAPTDEAFAKLPQSTLQDLLRPQNKGKLKRILTYHVVAGSVSASEIARLRSLKTVSGDTIDINASAGMVAVYNAKVLKTDIAASNGVIHVIDNVILPDDSK
jgi:uncharacterized surface protein with fasciclin (FAS1) repeats